MKKQVRLVLSAVLALSLVGAFAMFGCSSNNTTTEKKDDTAKTEQAEPVELQVFAANSLSKAMEDIQKAYIEDGHDNVTFKDTQYKSSGELNEMLGAGSYADLLISASKGSMDTAVSKGYVDESTRVDMFKNDLVMVSKEGAEMKDVTLQDIADGKYTICVGDDSVPAGNYAAQSLSTVGVYAPAGDDEGKTGKDITGKPVIGDIAKMPHMLIAGTTGSGKSVCINSMLISLLYKSTPEEVRLIMVDPKMVELGNYNGIPHLLIPVVTDPKKAAGALNWAVGEMERRYKLFADHQVRNLVGYNDLMRSEKAKAEQTEDGHPEQYQVLPQIVIVIDELADLMMVAAKEVENSICRIAQKARAAGMHLVVATQRPSADVITGIMKANIPSRIAFAVASQIESRIILDTTGAEKLIGKGDMLYAPLGEGKPTRVQGCFISNEEIEAVIARIKETSTAEYSEEILEHIEQQAEQVGNNKSGSSGTNDPGDDEDELIEEAIEVIMDCRQASTSMLQRRLKLGYSRAARIIDQIEDRGIIGPSEGSKPRQILISREDWQEMKLRRTMPLDKQQ